MRSAFFGIITFFSSLFIISDVCAYQFQSDELDSLSSMLESSSKKDTAYLEILITLARKIRQKNFHQSVAHFERAIELGRKLPDVHRLIRSYNGIGITYGMHDRYSEAIHSFNEGLHLALANNFAEDAGTSYGSLGIVYKRMGEYPTSLSYYTKAYQLYDSLGDRESVAETCHNLGVLFDLMREPDKALEYYHKALIWFEEQNDEKGIADIRLNVAILHLGKKEYDRAIGLFSNSLDYYKEQNITYSIINAMSNMGYAYLKKGEYTMAESYLEPALREVESQNLIQMKSAVLYNLAKTKAEKGNHSESITLANRTKELADSINSFRSKADAEELLSFVYEKAGNPAKALEHYKNFTSLTDSIFNDTKARSYKNQQVMMEVYEKDKQLHAQNLQLAFLNEKFALENRWKWTLGLASLLLLIAGTLYYQKYRQRLRYSGELESKNSLITQQKREIEEINLQLEKRMLRAQMNPHFIFNSLSSIQHFITGNDKVSALHYLSHFSNLLRQILETSVNVNMVLKDEIELIKIYLELEALRFDNDFEFEINVDEQLDTDMLEIPTMIIQPFVENAILHGLMPKKNDRKLVIDLVDDNTLVTCKIIDNGIGREEAEKLNNNKTGKSKSRGISVTRQRLELLARNHGVKTDIQYIDLKDNQGKPAGTQVIINIPKQEL